MHFLEHPRGGVYDFKAQNRMEDRNNRSIRSIDQKTDSLTNRSIRSIRSIYRFINIQVVHAKNVQKKLHAI